jgi:primase-polymerase (primpol)-like protein
MMGNDKTLTCASVKRDATRKPERMPIQAECIPAMMKSAARWLGWAWKLDNRTGKWTKPPRDIKHTRPGASTDPATWCEFSTALEAAQSGAVDGIGFALGDGFCGIDFDDCRDRITGQIAPDVIAYIRRLNTYAEISPSGEGVKLILRGELPTGRRANGRVEMYDQGRYFTVTGHKLDDCPCELANKDEVLAAVHAELIAGDEAAQQQRRESRLGDREIAQSALDGLSSARADSYHDWLLVGMALHATDSELLAAWDSWSQQSAKYSPGCCEAKWQSFNGSAVGLGSLIHWARYDSGWRAPCS